MRVNTYVIFKPYEYNLDFFICGTDCSSYRTVLQALAERYTYFRNIFLVNIQNWSTFWKSSQPIIMAVIPKTVARASQSQSNDSSVKFSKISWSKSNNKNQKATVTSC